MILVILARIYSVKFKPRNIRVYTQMAFLMGAIQLLLYLTIILERVDGQRFINGYLKTGFNSDCGILTVGYIRGGHRAEKYPWMAGILGATNHHGMKSFCGGSLITNRHIITAAHCVQGKGEDDIKVRLGAYNYANDTEPGVVDYDVLHIIRYPNYAHRSLKNDIAILTLVTKVQHANVITPICLPPRYKRTYVRKTATVVGWGDRGIGNGPSDILMQVNVPVWDNNKCQSIYGPQRIDSKVLCAGQTGKDSCAGDSGGPLMLKGRASKWTIIGVVSGGAEKCGEPGYPGIYTRVNEFLNWIANHISSTEEIYPQEVPVSRPPQVVPVSRPPQEVPVSRPPQVFRNSRPPQEVPFSRIFSTETSVSSPYGVVVTPRPSQRVPFVHHILGALFPQPQYLAPQQSPPQGHSFSTESSFTSLGEASSEGVRVSGHTTGYAGQRNEIIVDIGNTNLSTLQLSFRGPGNIVLTAQSKTALGGRNKFFYHTERPGLFYLSIKSDGNEVSGSPFKINVIQKH